MTPRLLLLGGPGLAAGLFLSALGGCSNATSGTGPLFYASAADSDMEGSDATVPRDAHESGALGDTGMSDAESGGDYSQDASADAGSQMDAPAEAQQADGPPDGAEDAPLDAGPGDAGPDVVTCSSGVICNGACTSDADCTACSGAPLLCAGSRTCVASCVGCQSTSGTLAPIECFACYQNHQNPFGQCAPRAAAAYCLSGNYAMSYKGGGVGYRCQCGDAGASACPGQTQVCAPTFTGVGLCITGGEEFPTDVTGFTCKSGAMCVADAAACR